MSPWDKIQIIIEYLICLKEVEIASKCTVDLLLNKCYKKGILSQNIEFPTDWPNSWGSKSRLYDIGWGNLENFKIFPPVKLTVVQTHALNAMVIITVIPAFDLCGYFPENSLGSACFLYTTLNNRHGRYPNPSQDTIDSIGHEIINRLRVPLEEMGDGTESTWNRDIDMELSDSELGEVKFGKSNLRVSSLQSLGQIRIKCKVLP